VAELGEANVILANPRHPYTMALLASMPSMDSDRCATEAPVSGDPPIGRVLIRSAARITA
jgi:peptide/nickel transport system ATP-binding protein